MKTYGKIDWAFSLGRIPLDSRPESSKSYDGLSILNTSKEETEIELVIFYEDEPPVGRYSLKVPAQRLRKFRMNDLIDPFPIRLERNYGCLIRASHPVVIQFVRRQVQANSLAITGTTAFAMEPEN